MNNCSNYREISCENVKKHIYDYANGEISGELEFEIKKHLENCAECREEYEQIKLMCEILPQTDYTPDNRIYENVMAEISKGENSEKLTVKKNKFGFSGLARIASVAAVVVCAVGVGLIINRNFYIGVDGTDEANNNTYSYESNADNEELDDLSEENYSKDSVQTEVEIETYSEKNNATEETMAQIEAENEEPLTINFYAEPYDENKNDSYETLSENENCDKYAYVVKLVSEIYGDTSYTIDVYRNDELKVWTAVISLDGMQLSVLYYNDNYELVMIK